MARLKKAIEAVGICSLFYVSNFENIEKGIP